MDVESGGGVEEGQRGGREGEAFKLLPVSGTDSDSDLPEFPLAPLRTKRKVRPKRRPSGVVRKSGVNGRPPLPCSSPHKRHLQRPLLIAALLLLLGWVGALSWLTLHMQAQLQDMALQLHGESTGSQGLSETLHSYSSALQDVKQNQSYQVAALTALEKRVEELTLTVNDLQKRLSDREGSSPKLEGLPKTMNNLENLVAKLGSQTNDVESLVKQDKENIVKLQGTLHTLQESGVELWGNFTHLQDTMDTYNYSLQESILDANKHIQHYRVELSSLHALVGNLSHNLDILQSEWQEQKMISTSSIPPPHTTPSVTIKTTPVSHTTNQNSSS